MSEFDYPELLEHGTASGPVTAEMRALCQERVRRLNRRLNLPEDYGMEWWPDCLPVIRKELLAAARKRAQ